MYKLSSLPVRVLYATQIASTLLEASASLSYFSLEIKTCVNWKKKICTSFTTPAPPRNCLLIEGRGIICKMFRQFNLHTGLVLRVNGAADDPETNQNIWWFWLFGKLLFLYFLVSWHVNCGCYLNIVLSLEAAGSVGIMTAFLEALEINAWGRMCCCFVTETYLSASHRGGISENQSYSYVCSFWRPAFTSSQIDFLT